MAADLHTSSGLSRKERPWTALPRKVLELPVGKLLVADLFLLAFLFQIFLISRFAFLYVVLKAFFVCLLLLLALAVVRLARKEKLILLCLIFILLIRIPYYVHPDSLLFMSDNALEALQPLEIRDAKAAPFFLLDSSSHNGTLKYLCVAFIWDFLGVNYLTFLLFQLLIYMGFIYLVYDWLRGIFNEKIVLLLIFVHFAFVEVLFDYSLFLRAAPYLEMLFFFVLGVRLFDFSFRDMKRLFLAVYFFMIAVYLHSLAIFLVIPFVLAAVLYAIKLRAVLRWAGLLLAGVAAGQFHFVYYKLFYPPPPPGGSWYEIRFFSLANFALNRIPAYLAQLVRDFWVIFQNLLSFEFSYHFQKWKSFEFYFQSPAVRTLLFILNRVLVYLSLAVFLTALVLAVVKIARRGFFGKAAQDWITIFYVLTFLVFLGKLFMLSPAPHLEPRHNMDLAFLLLLSYVMVAAEFLKIRRVFSWKSLVAVGLCLLFTAPHYFTFLRVADFKQHSYQVLIPLLKSRGVKYLNTDFSIAYIIYFLSNRRIKVTDSVGPVTIDFFYYWMKKEVDAVPVERQAYLFFTDRYPRERWNKEASRRSMRAVLSKLNRLGTRYEIIRLKYYLLIIPEPSRIYQTSGRSAPLR
ncbi:MAG TPA: hypothetical protein VGB72_03015 [Acidobacteriota bacterium]